MIKEYSELVVDFNIKNELPDFKLSAGIYKNDEHEAFIFEIVDMRHKGKVYVNSFNSEWCPEKNKEWLATVLIRQMMDNIKSAVESQKKVTKDMYDVFIKTFK